MDVNDSNNTPASGNGATDTPVPSASPVSPLELNAIRLDANHTVLTPDYLEKIKAGSTAEQVSDAKEES